ncbi:hypothetical protein QOT17_012430 [Balamuthia mandrillaris]
MKSLLWRTSGGVAARGPSSWCALSRRASKTGNISYAASAVGTTLPKDLHCTRRRCFSSSSGGQKKDDQEDADEEFLKELRQVSEQLGSSSNFSAEYLERMEELAKRMNAEVVQGVAKDKASGAAVKFFASRSGIPERLEIDPSLANDLPALEQLIIKAVEDNRHQAFPLGGEPGEAGLLPPS